MGSFRRACAVASIALALAGCRHWYTGATIAGVGGGAVGFGLGAIIPCQPNQPDCKSTNEPAMAALFAVGALGFWGIFELISMQHDDDYASSGSSYDPPSTYEPPPSDPDPVSYDPTPSTPDPDPATPDPTTPASDPPAGDKPADTACHQESVGAPYGALAEDTLGGDYPVSASDHAQATTPLEACDEAKYDAFLELRTRCGFSDNYRSLSKWVVYHQVCDCTYCPNAEIGGTQASCSVTVQGECTSSYGQPQFGWGSDDSRDGAIARATLQAQGLCNMHQTGEDRTLGCETETWDQGTQKVTGWVCAVSVGCEAYH